MKKEFRSYPLWILVQRSETIEGVWRADIPALDYFAQGRSLTAAIEAAQEVATTLILADLNAGRMPLGVGTTEGEKAIGQVMLRSEPIRMDQLDQQADEIEAVVVGFRVDCVKHTVVPVTVAEQRREAPREQAAAQAQAK